MSNSLSKVIVLVSIPLFLIAGYLLFKLNTATSKNTNISASGTTVYDLEGKQIIELIAKAGYFPSSTTAEADKDTILRVITDSTFDCSSALTIPKLGIRRNLAPTAVTDIPLGTQTPGTKLIGTCTMGMYNFDLTFN